MILRLAQYGLIHGDFNEFNILIKEETTMEGTETLSLTPILIDFPQMVSMDHENAEYYFDRDVNCIKRFFERRFHFTSDSKGPHFKDARKLIGKDGVKRLDVSVAASGFSRKMAKELEAYMKSVGVDGDGNPNAARGDESDGEELEDDEVAEDEDEVYVAGEASQDSEKSLTKSNSSLEEGMITDRFGNEVSVSKLHIGDLT